MIGFFSGDKRPMILGGIKCESVPSDLLFNVCVDPIFQNSYVNPFIFKNI